MKILGAEFVKSCESRDQLPKDRLPEIAFVGRSNVGKSSLINSLLHRRGLAKVSGTPGKTRHINFFRVVTGDPLVKTLYVVDLPGYGYAKVAKSVRAQWGPLIERYVTDREELCGVVLLVDARGLEPHDVTTYQWLRALGHDPIVVTTKADKLAQGVRRAREHETRTGLAVPGDGELVCCSSHTHEGREALWAAIKRRCRQRRAGGKHETDRDP